MYRLNQKEKEKTTVVYDTNRNWHLQGYIQVNCVNTDGSKNRTEVYSVTRRLGLLFVS